MSCKWFWILVFFLCKSFQKKIRSTQLQSYEPKMEKPSCFNPLGCVNFKFGCPSQPRCSQKHIVIVSTMLAHFQALEKLVDVLFRTCLIGGWHPIFSSPKMNIKTCWDNSAWESKLPTLSGILHGFRVDPWIHLRRGIWVQRITWAENYKNQPFTNINFWEMMQIKL